MADRELIDDLREQKKQYVPQFPQAAPSEQTNPTYQPPVYPAGSQQQPPMQRPPIPPAPPAPPQSEDREVPTPPPKNQPLQPPESPISQIPAQALQKEKIPGDRMALGLLAILFVLGMGTSGLAGLMFSSFSLIFITTLGVTVTFGIVTLLMIAKTNAWTELKSSLRGTPVILLYRRDKTIQRVSCLYKIDSVETAKHGTFILTPDSVYRDKKTNLPVVTAYSTYGATISPQFAMTAATLKKGGIENIDDADAVNAQIKARTGGDSGLGINPNYQHTIRWDDVVGWFKYHINPHYIQALIERNTALNLKGVRQLPLGWITAMAILFVAAAIAYAIVAQSAPSGGGGGSTIIPTLVG